MLEAVRSGLSKRDHVYVLFRGLGGGWDDVAGKGGPLVDPPVSCILGLPA